MVENGMIPEEAEKRGMERCLFPVHVCGECETDGKEMPSRKSDIASCPLLVILFFQFDYKGHNSVRVHYCSLTSRWFRLGQGAAHCGGGGSFFLFACRAVRVAVLMFKKSPQMHV